TESFFLLGGDSIKAMRIVSRAREAGYDLKVQTILEKRTIRNIAQQMQKTTDKEKWEQGEIVGKVTDTPILRMFKQWALPEPTHFNQSVIIPTALPNQESLQLVLDKIIAHHDSLRARYVEGQLTVYSMAESEFYRLSERTFDSGSSTFERDWAEEMKLLQEGMDLVNGPMVQAGLYTIDTEKYLVVIIHHLVVDGVSWRVLLEDINNLSRQLLAKEVLRLPQKTMSYQ
ncbi:hypothetical protein HCA53_14725, partial [Listeria innocua]|uniref:condensation domain-containing protein n=1 Tax=Listeria innocua TaxID=1642 RepID=UPI001847E0D1